MLRLIPSASGEMTTVDFELSVTKQLAVWHGTIDGPGGGAGWRHVPGTYTVTVGGSSRDARLEQRVQVQ